MQTERLTHVKKATAILMACLVQTLDESDNTFQERFLERLSRAYRELKDNTDGEVQHELELLSWTRELLTGFNIVQGQGKAFLED